MNTRTQNVTDAHTESLIADLVAWVDSRPRRYDETMQAWRTSCPRLTIWEDALDRGYVSRLPQGRGPAWVVATDSGRAFVAARAVNVTRGTETRALGAPAGVSALAAETGSGNRSDRSRSGLVRGPGLCRQP